MEYTGTVESVERAFAKTGNAYARIVVNGKTFSVFNDVDKMLGSQGKAIQYSTVQKGQYENFDGEWTYAPAGMVPDTPPMTHVDAVTGGVPREDMILRQSSLKAGIDIARLTLEADKLPVVAKKDPALIEEYVKDLTVRLFHWVKAGDWELLDADKMMEEG